MTTINAHFDGVVLVPEQPIDVPAGTALRVSYEPIAPVSGATPKTVAAGRQSMVDRLPLVRGLDPQLVRPIIEEPENELSNMGAEEFLRGKRKASDQT
jgi:hypothetical protein